MKYKYTNTMPRTITDNNSKNKGRNYKKSRPDPESSSSDEDSDSNYETMSDTESYTSSSYVDTSSYSTESDRKPKSKKKGIKKDDTANLQDVIQKLLAKNKKLVKEASKSTKSKSKSKSKHESSDEEEDYEEEDEEESVYEEDGDNEDNEDESEDNDSDDDEKDDKTFKITMTIGGQPVSGMKNRIPSNLSNEDEYNTDDEEIYMKEDFQAMELPGMPLSPSNSATDIMTPSAVPKRKPKEVVPDPLSEVVNIDEKYREIIELKRVLIDKLRSKPNNKIVQKAVDQCNRSIKKLIKHARSKNANTYEELLEKADTQVITDEIGYFKTKLSNKEQLRIMSDLREINGYMYVEKPYRLTLLQSNMPAKFKAVALQRLHQLSLMEPGDPEYFKLKNWVDNFMRLPFGIYKSLSINIRDGIDKCSDFVVNAKEQLDKCVYGLEDAKMQIMQMVGQWIANPSSIGTAIAIHGPPGTGKTSLVKDGISKILGREFAFIALGGCGDSSFLEGHSYTYEGSTWGRIAQIVMESKCMNPVIYFDELDKISDTARGQEIIGVLTHLTDTSQNNQFHDKYFSEIELDLSKCMFIFSYNDENLVNPILRDRMYRIRTKGYDLKEKMIIARNHILPKIREQVGFGPDEIVFPDDVLSHIISNQAKGEEGVRNLKRSLEIIHTKLNLYRLVKSGTQMFSKEMGLNVTFPYTLSRKDVDTLVKVDNQGSSALSMMYI
jgi:hypothetical protein